MVLKAKKVRKESFSEVIVRLSGKRKLSDSFGVLNKKVAEELEKNIILARKERNKEHKKRLVRL